MVTVIIDQEFLVKNNPYKNQDVGEHDLVSDYSNLIKWKLDLKRFETTVGHNSINKILHSSILSKNCPIILSECPLGFDGKEQSNSLDLLIATTQRTCYALTFKKPSIMYSSEDLNKELFGISKNGKKNEGGYVYRLMARGFRNIEFHVFAEIDFSCFNLLCQIRKENFKEIEKKITLNYNGSIAKNNIEPRLDKFKLVVHDDLKREISNHAADIYNYYNIDKNSDNISHAFFRKYNSMHFLKEVLYVEKNDCYRQRNI